MDEIHDEIHTDEILRVENLTKVFESEGGQRSARTAVDHLSFTLPEGASLGLVGESGSGKSTVARMIAGLERPTEGRILLRMTEDGSSEGSGICEGSTPKRSDREQTDPADQEWTDLGRVKRRESGRICRYVQMVFQNPQGSFDPRQTLGAGICESLRNRGVGRKEAWQQAAQLMEACGLDPDYLKKYPHEVSGGQCQRAAIARAVINHPRLLLLDEPTSALDVTVQKQILGLLTGLRAEYHMSFLFITHDLAVAQQMCDHILVIRDGRLVEENRTEDLIRHPESPYTRLLLESVL